MLQNVYEHTMEKALYGYLALKMHPLVRQFAGRTIIVRGRFMRDNCSIASTEKADKPFNWMRPTATIANNGETLFLNCFPGIDYVRHYALLVDTYLRINCLPVTSVFVELPDQDAALRVLHTTNLVAFPRHDVVILGKVEALLPLTQHQPWQGQGAFSWSSGVVGGKNVALVGCRFSIWGDSAGAVVRVLASKGVKTVIYVGKLGTLIADLEPNQYLATGCTSMLNGNRLVWDNVIKVAGVSDNVVHGDHVTVFSVMAETKVWYGHEGYRYDFVDPEIGHMALAAIEHQINFGYLHIISDNVAVAREENLSNERKRAIVLKRKELNNIICSTLKRSFLEDQGNL